MTLIGRGVIAGPAEKNAFIGINDPAYNGDPNGFVTLIGLVQTNEGTPANSFGERWYIVEMYNDSFPIPTRYVPFGGLPLPPPT